LTARKPQQFAYLLHKIVNGELVHKKLFTPAGTAVEIEDHPLGHIIRPENENVTKELRDLFLFDDRGNVYALEQNDGFFVITGLLNKVEKEEA